MQKGNEGGILHGGKTPQETNKQTQMYHYGRHFVSVIAVLRDREPYEVRMRYETQPLGLKKKPMIRC